MGKKFFKLIKNEKAEPICPYCNKLLEARPLRKKKCPFCGNFIFVRTTPARKKVLVTEAEAKEIDKEWSFIHSKNEWIRRLNINEKIFDNYSKELKKRFKSEPATNDVFWYILNDRLRKSSGDFFELKMTYFHMAHLLNEEKKDFFEMKRLERKMELLMHQSSALSTRRNKVEIISGGDCPECKKLNGKILTIEEALGEMPLPNPKCQNSYAGGKKGFCFCTYRPKRIYK